MKKLALPFLVFLIFGAKAQTPLTTDELVGQINTITTAVPFVSIAPDSRAGAMGDMGVATSADAFSSFWNPSKYIFTKERYGISASYTPWLRQLVPDINLLYASVYGKINEKNALAASFTYFSLGNIVFTNISGQQIGIFNPKEMSTDLSYARKLSDRWSAGVTARYIYSNLTGGIDVQGSKTFPGKSIAGGISAFYTHEELFDNLDLNWGINISNVGSKVRYSDRAGEADFIPINLGTGVNFVYHLTEKDYFAFGFEFNKLLVPSPPVYAVDSTGAPKVNPDGSYVILAGKDPNRSVVQGMLGSFSDAPGGMTEELREINTSFGFEYGHNDMLFVRSGFFYEHATKGNRQFITMGVGTHLSIFRLDFAYLIPTAQRNPLENTVRVSLSATFDRFKFGKCADCPAFD